MLQGKKVVVVMPAYNAEKTLEETYREIPRDIVDEIIVIDDHSKDRTVEVAKRLGLPVYVHEENKGYGANQKTCYKEALKRKADIIIMLHPDYQYPPKLIPAMAVLLTSGILDIVLGSSVLGYLLYTMMLKKYTATFLSFAGFIQPLCAAILGWFFLGEYVTYTFFLSAILVFSGLYLFYQEELKQGYVLK